MAKRVRRRADRSPRGSAGTASARPARARLAGQCGRADLLLALDHGDAPGAAMAELLGFVYAPRPEQRGPEPAATKAPTPPAKPGRDATEPPPEVSRTPLLPALFWLPERFEPRTREPPQEPAPERPIARTPSTAAPPPSPRLAAWSELRTRLHPALARQTPGRALDTARLVALIARGRHVQRIPRHPRSRRNADLLVLVDRSEHLVPYWQDQEALLARLAAESSRDGLRILAVHERAPPPGIDAATPADLLPAAGGLCLVIGDLGCLRTRPDATLPWLTYARRLRAAGIEAVALLPCAPARCSRPLRAAWRTLHWERVCTAVADAAPASTPAGLVADAAEAAEAADGPLAQLLTVLAPAIRLEPGLVRTLRRRLPACRADAGLEADLWQHGAIAGMHSDAGTWAPGALPRWRERFAALPASLRAEVLACLRDWREHLPREIWFEELLSLDDASRALDPVRADSALADRFAIDLSARLRAGSSGLDPARAAQWFQRADRRLSDAAYARPATSAALHCLARHLRPRDAAVTRRPGDDPAYAADPALPERVLRVIQRQDGLGVLAGDAGAPLSAGESTVALIRCGVPELQLLPGSAVGDAPRPAPDRDPAFWEVGEPPAWASRWGWDEHGAWAEITLQGKDGEHVIQRLRWIEPGSFLMGSPETEAGRWDAEGPQHAVQIAEGFWLFDTPVTQALWQAVLGDNPSRFKGHDRPVERVSWEDTQRFLAAINARVPRLDLRLPSEAQWEYACRAGSTTRWCCGDDAAALGEYAWYAENAGGETHAVAGKRPNDWGLYDCHGNVWEWVEDVWRGSYAGAPADGSAWEASSGPGAGRALRGGSWYGVARLCRSAFRGGGGPGDRGGGLGFRCARAQARELRSGPAGSGGDERSDRPRADPARGSGLGRFGAWPHRGAGGAHGGREGEQTAPAVSAAAGATVRVGAAETVCIALPDSPVLLLRTDREQLTLRRLPRPAWAHAAGRDRYGLWADIRIEAPGAQPVRQRLRWIPPGRFTMGSPADEPGRYDDEGPQHEVVIEQGYWLFDTPTTQALWEAVLGAHQSRFRDPRRPVENVEWADARRFIDALNARLPPGGDTGTRFALPSEAQWEYACRAGTTTALYSGPIEIPGANNAPALDPIAWYGGNSGEGYELAQGHDSSGWREMQYPNPKSGTRPVGLKAPNPWGLYDMLGNVWEWTEDHWHGSYDGAPADGTAWLDADAATGAGRAIRGGSWAGNARYCRSAYRRRVVPDLRRESLGFRCARAQVP
jgi:formylglycine-generating enzyme required for sulfatase activity